MATITVGEPKKMVGYRHKDHAYRWPVYETKKGRQVAFGFIRQWEPAGRYTANVTVHGIKFSHPSFERLVQLIRTMSHILSMYGDDAYVLLESISKEHELK